MIRLRQGIYITDKHTRLKAGDYKVGVGLMTQELAAMAVKKGWGRMLGEAEVESSDDNTVSDDLPANDEIIGLLADASDEDRDAYFDEYTVEQLNATLKERFDVEISGRNHGQAANMLMDRMGIKGE